MFILSSVYDYKVQMGFCIQWMKYSLQCHNELIVSFSSFFSTDPLDHLLHRYPQVLHISTVQNRKQCLWIYMPHSKKFIEIWPNVQCFVFRVKGNVHKHGGHFLLEQYLFFNYLFSYSAWSMLILHRTSLVLPCFIDFLFFHNRFCSPF